MLAAWRVRSGNVVFWFLVMELVEAIDHKILRRLAMRSEEQGSADRRVDLCVFVTIASRGFKL